MNENFRFLTQKWILWPKKMTAHDVCFSVRGVKDLFPDLLLERGQEKKFPGFF